VTINAPKLPRVCVFDFDGTLVDTMGGFADIAAEVLEKHYGIPRVEGHRRYLRTSGIPFFQQLEIIRPGGSKNPDCAEEFESKKLQGFFDSAPPQTTVSGLEMLAVNGIGLVVSSNNFQHNVDAYLDKYPLPLDLALGFDENGMEKGRPHFSKVQGHFGIGPGDMLFCGDSLKDAERAMSCDVGFVGKTGTFSRDQFLERFEKIDTVDNIQELAERFLGRSSG
jgi:beta-phosphoglucomutase-like phosphatase (HAD superfamily)